MLYLSWKFIGVRLEWLFRALHKLWTPVITASPSGYSPTCKNVKKKKDFRFKQTLVGWIKWDDKDKAVSNDWAALYMSHTHTHTHLFIHDVMSISNSEIIMYQSKVRYKHDSLWRQLKKAMTSWFLIQQLESVMGLILFWWNWCSYLDGRCWTVCLFSYFTTT